MTERALIYMCICNTLFYQMKDDKMDVEFLVAVMKTARPENVTTFDDEKEAEYRKNVNDCNKESKCE